MCHNTLISNITITNTSMVKTNTVLGKAVALAMLPALTLGIFATPGVVSADEGGVTTIVKVSNANMGFSMTDVASGANSGGNTIVSGASSKGGDTGSNVGVLSGAAARTANTANVDDVEGETERGEGEVEAEAEVAGDAAAYSSATARTGNAGNAGRAMTVSTIATGEATSDVMVVGGSDKNEVDIDVTDDCDCDRANEYHEASVQYMDLSMSSEYDNYYRDVEEESETEGGDRHHGDSESEWEYSEGVVSEEGSSDFDMSAGSAWEVSTKEYVPVKTIIGVENVNTSVQATRVISGANSGMNTLLAGSMSEGGDTGSNMLVGSAALASAENSADLDDVEGETERGEGEVEAEAGAYGNAEAGSSADATTGNAGNGADAATDSMIVSGRSNSIVTIVETSRHNVVRIQR